MTAAVCEPPCQNGGECYAPGHCVCPDGWGGSLCETGAIQLKVAKEL